MIDLRAPIYARAFTANIARRKMEEQGHAKETVTTVSAWPEKVTRGRLRWASCRFRIRSRKASALVIDSPEGRVIHSGDFKLDETPLVGEPFDPKPGPK